MKPFLAILKQANGAEVKLRVIINGIYDHFQLSEQERFELFFSGKQAIIDNRMGWSRTYIEIAQRLSTRIVLINGIELAKLMLRYNIGSRNEQTLQIKKIDEEFFELN